MRLLQRLRGLVTAPGWTWRYGIVAALAFTLGSATIVTAAISGLSIGSIFFISMLNGVATTPCTTITSSTGKETTTCVAVVNSKGELATKDADVRAALDRLSFGADGSLKVSSQGTSSISGNVAVTGGNINVDNFPATQAVSGSVNVNNFPATQPVSGTVNVGNLPAVQQIQGTVTVTNLPAVGTGGVTRITLAAGTANPGDFVIYRAVDVSSCRTFAVHGWSNTSGRALVSSIQVSADGNTNDFAVDLKVKDDLGAGQWAFPVQPFSTETFFATSIDIWIQKTGSAGSVEASIYCQH